MSNTCTRRGICLVLSAPSGAGKSSLARALLAKEPQAELSVSVTTRLARPGEQDGTDYHFTSDAAFAELAERGGLLEWARVFGRGYGTPRQPVEAALLTAVGLPNATETDALSTALLVASATGQASLVTALRPGMRHFVARKCDGGVTAEGNL